MSQTKAQLLDGKSATIQFTGGSASAPSVSFTGDTNTGIYSPGADQVAISTGGSGRLFVDASGNVGIGNNAPLLAAGYTSLRLNGSTGGLLELTSAATRVLQIQSFGAAGGAQITTIDNGSSPPLIFGTNSAERLRITAAGLVGVGTSNAQALLDLTAASGADHLAIRNWPMLKPVGTGVQYGGYNSSQWTELSYWTSGSRALTIDSQQRVGVGTTSPSFLLDLFGTTPALRIKANGVGNGIKLEQSSATGDVELNVIDGYPLVFKTSNTERLRIDSSGRVGIGTSSPGARLHSVETSAAEGLRVDGAAGGFSLVVEGGTTRATRIRQATIGNSYVGNTPPTDGLLVQGSVGIGTTAPPEKLTIASGNIYLDAAAPKLYLGTDGFNYIEGSANPTNILKFFTSNAERVRIDSSGRLLVGTSTSRSQIGITPLFQVEGTSNTGSIGVINNTSNAGGGYLVLGKTRGSSVGSTASVINGDTVGAIYFNGADGTNLLGLAYIAAEVDGTPGANDMPGRLVFSTTADGASSPTERMRISSNGQVRNTAPSGTTIFYTNSEGAAGTGFSFYFARSGNNADTEFDLRGDGTGLCDGSWTGGGADYAEYFEWSDSNPDAEDRRGISVALDGEKIREAVAGEDPIGVISGNPSVVGDAAWNKWIGKYLRDEFGTYLLNENGNRQLNPAYDPDQEYIPREQRPEWDCVGLMGKLRIRKGQVTGARWIKMRDISDSVEEWLVR